jgi:hypothetical protein
MAYYLSFKKVKKIKSLVKFGISARHTATIVGVSKDTVLKYRNIFINPEEKIYCPCGRPMGHSGFCQWMLNQPYYESRKNYLDNVRVEKPPRIIRPPISNAWPYWSKEKEVPDFLHEINKMIPEKIPEKIRADIGQDIVLDLLEQKITIEEIPKLLRKYISKQHQLLQSKYRFISLNQPTKGYDNLLIGDTISNSVFHF